MTTTRKGIPVRVVLADDNEIFREGFLILLKKQTEIEIVGEAENGRELIDLVNRTQPDIIITDIKMPLMDGVEATKKLNQLYPEKGVIAFTMFEEDTLIVDMLEAGARGYLLKNASKREIFEAVRTVFEGGVYYCNSTNTRLARLIGDSKFNPYRELPRSEFSPKEREIIQLICRELSNKEIAQLMYMSVRTVEGYREKLLKKTGARNSVGIVIYAIKHGMFQVNPPRKNF